MTLLRKARFRLSLWAWARVLPLVAWNRSLGSLMALTHTGSRVPYAGLTPEYIVRRVRRATRRPRLMRDRPCLRQGVLAMRFLRLAGYNPDLHFAVDRKSVGHSVLAAHCWVALDGKVILNPATPTMVEILAYKDGRLLPSAPAAATASLA
jgi:hypothetical protein